MRPLKLTPETRDKIVNAVTAGHYQGVAARLAGVGESTFYMWMAKGREGEFPYCELVEAMAQAEAEAEAVRVQEIMAAGKLDWRAHAWYLERKFNDRWGKVDRVSAQVEHSGQVTQNHEYTIEQKLETDPESAELLRRLYARSLGTPVGDTSQG